MDRCGLGLIEFKGKIRFDFKVVEVPKDWTDFEPKTKSIEIIMTVRKGLV